MKAALSLLLAAVSCQAGVNVGPERAWNVADYVKVKGTRNMFYWFFESRSNPATDPVVLWMTGGPGCSGLLALFKENGPYQVRYDRDNNALNYAINAYSWNNNASIMFVDQPVGTGFSYDDSWIDPGVLNEDDMASDMYDLLTSFMTKYPKYSRLPFYIAAESYGGHYAPALGHWIVNHKTPLLNLKGVLVGNGLVDPYNQYPGYPEFAQDRKLVNDVVLVGMNAALPVCRQYIAKCAGTQRAFQERTAARAALGDHSREVLNVSDWQDCMTAYELCNLAELFPVTSTGINLYDVTKTCDFPPLCYDFTNVTNFLNWGDVQKPLGVNMEWQSCNKLVTMKLVFAGDWMLSFTSAVRELLAAGVRVLVYHGEDDYVCNWIGGHMWTEALEWPGQVKYRSLPLNTTFPVDNKPAAYYKSYSGLTFMKVLKSGHMVPMDQPKFAVNMLNWFIHT